MRFRTPTVLFFASNVVVWLVMTAILVVVPDYLESVIGFQAARIAGWVVACGVWVVAVEAQWQRRFGPVSRVLLQLVLWVGAALAAVWISSQARVAP
jgi:hypothetical protein